VMGIKGVGYGFVLAFVVVSRGVLASEPSCVTATFYGVVPSFERAVREQLQNELDVPVIDEEDGRSCWSLVIEMRGKSARILLYGDRLMKTEFELSDVAPRLWPRAIALSSAGFLELSKKLTHHATDPGSDETEPDLQNARVREDEDGRSKAEEQPKASEGISRSANIAPRENGASGRVRLHFLTGARLIPKFWVAMVEALPGIGVRFGLFCLDISAIGLWGQKKTNIGRIYNAGVGARLTLWWQALRRKRSEMWLGPAAEGVAVWAYGREKADAATSHTAFAPVVDFLFLIGGAIALTARTNASIALGVGWTAMYFNMQADNEDISGLSGGLATLVFGIDFGI
jgi:hypothetical protein